MIFNFIGTPVAKKRHRTANGRTYNPQNKEEAAVKWEARQQASGVQPMTGPVEMTVKAYFPRPKSHFGTGRNAGNVKSSAPPFHTKKPDLDNIVKFYKDCLNGIAYTDDCQVIAVSCTKHWSEPSLFPQGIVMVEVAEETKAEEAEA